MDCKEAVVNVRLREFGEIVKQLVNIAVEIFMQKTNVRGWVLGWVHMYVPIGKKLENVAEKPVVSVRSGIG